MLRSPLNSPLRSSLRAALLSSAAAIASWQAEGVSPVEPLFGVYIKGAGQTATANVWVNGAEADAADYFSNNSTSEKYVTNADGTLKLVAAGDLPFSDQGILSETAATNGVRSPLDLDGTGWNQAINCTTSGDTVPYGVLTLQGISADGGQAYPQIRGGGSSDAITVGVGEKCSVTYYVTEGSSPSFYVGLTPTTALQTSGAVFDWSSGSPVHSGNFSIHAGTDVDSHQIKALGGGLYRIRSTIQNNSGGSLSYYPFIYPIDVSTGDATVYDNALYIGGINVIAGDKFSSLIGSKTTRAADDITCTNMAWSSGLTTAGYSILMDFDVPYLENRQRHVAKLRDVGGATGDYADTLILSGDAPSVRSSGNGVMSVATDVSVGRNKIAGWIAENDGAAWLNGGSEATDVTLTPVPTTFDTFHFGRNEFGAQVNGYIKSWAFCLNANTNRTDVQNWTALS